MSQDETTVAAYGIRRLPVARATRLPFAVGLVAVSLAVTAGVAALVDGDLVDWAPLVLAADAFALGVAQYSALRNENSLDHQYDRLHASNLMWVQYEDARPDRDDLFVGRDALPGEWRVTRSKYLFYVFTELDNLEYSIEKFRHGLMTELLADRALRTFAARLRRPRFYSAVEVHYGHAPYTPETRRVIEAMMRKTCPSDQYPERSDFERAAGRFRRRLLPSARRTAP